MEINEEIDNKFLTGRNDAEDLPEASRHGWAHAPYWPTVTNVHPEIFQKLTLCSEPEGWVVAGPCG
jgi:hypothetical protein